MVDRDEARGFRLRQAREAANYKTASEAARALHIALSTYLAHEAGSRGLRPTAAYKYAQAFQVDVQWLLYGIGDPSGSDLADKIHSLSPAQRAEVERFIQSLSQRRPKV